MKNFDERHKEEKENVNVSRRHVVRAIVPSMLFVTLMSMIVAGAFL